MRPALGMVIGLVSVAIGHAHAQSGDAGAIAQQLFNQARDLAKANRWAEACPKFEASLRSDPALGTRLNLAGCYEHIDRLASAWSLYRESADLAKNAGDVKRRDYAQRQAAALEPRLARLTISTRATPPAGFIVIRDGTQIDLGALGIALFVDAGSHEIIASAPGFEAFKHAVTMVDGKSEAVDIPALVAKPAPVVAHGATRPASAQPAAGTEPAGPRSRTRTYIAIGAGGVGAASVATGLVFGVKANSTYSDVKALCGADVVCRPENYAQANRLMHDARVRATTATVLVIAGGAAIAAGVVVWGTAPPARERAVAQIVPVLGDHEAGLVIAGGF